MAAWRFTNSSLCDDYSKEPMIKNFQRYALFLLLATSTVSSLCAQVSMKKLGQSTMNFLLVSPSPRASAMGEATASILGGSEAVFFNPAGLAKLSSDAQLNMGMTKWIADITYMGGSAAFNIGDYGAVGIHFLTVDYGTIIGTSLLTQSEFALYPAGYKETGPVGNVGAYSTGISYAININTQFAVGGTVKIAGQNLGTSIYSAGFQKENNAVKVVFDGGVKYETGFYGFAFGMAIRNFSSDVRRELIDEPLPLSFVLGSSINLMEAIAQEKSEESGLTLAVDFLHQNSYSERINIGVEYLPLPMLVFRGGYRTNNDIASWSAGLGLKTTIESYGVSVDYSFSRYQIFDNVNRLSIGFTL